MLPPREALVIDACRRPKGRGAAESSSFCSTVAGPRTLAASVRRTAPRWCVGPTTFRLRALRPPSQPPPTIPTPPMVDTAGVVVADASR